MNLTRLSSAETATDFAAKHFHWFHLFCFHNGYYIVHNLSKKKHPDAQSECLVYLQLLCITKV